MKKVISFVFVFLLVSACLLLPASAAGNGVLSISSASAFPGESVTLVLSVTENPGISTFSVQVKFDTAALQLTSVTAQGDVIGSIAVNQNYASPYQMSWIDSRPVENRFTGTVATLTFRILDGALPGTSNVSVSFQESYDLNLGKNTFNSPTATVTINCPSHIWGDTAENAGVQHKRFCTRCGAETLEGHTAGEWSASEPAGCTTPGKEKTNCTLCGSEMQHDTDPLGHSFGEWQTVTPAGCTNPGKDERECSRCHTKENRDTNPLGHAFSASVVTKPATCKETGVETGTCNRCNEKTENAIPLLAHDYTPWETDRAASCTEAGTQKRECRSCGHKLTRNVAATGHDFEDPQVKKEATLFEEGLIEGKCKKCNETTQQILPCTAKDEASGVEINAKAGVFKEGTSVSISQEVDDTLRENLSAIGSEFHVYAVNFDKAGETVFPSEVFTLLLPSPEFEEVEVYCATEQGELVPVEFSVKEDGTLVIETNRAGVFALVNSDSEPVRPTHPQQPETSDSEPEPSVPSGSSGALSEENEQPKSGSVVGIVIILTLILAGLAVSYWYFFVYKR